MGKNDRECDTVEIQSGKREEENWEGEWLQAEGEERGGRSLLFKHQLS